jgi:hypothetical protein
VLAFVNQHTRTETVTPVYGCPLKSTTCDSTMERPWTRS